MANPIAINGTHYRQEQYANSIVKLMRQQFNIRNDFSRDYEGKWDCLNTFFPYQRGI